LQQSAKIINLQKLRFPLQHSDFSLINHHYAEIRAAKHIHIGLGFEVEQYPYLYSFVVLHSERKPM
jgi:hypothetical protein